MALQLTMMMVFPVYSQHMQMRCNLKVCITKLSPPQFQLSLSFAELRLALIPFNPPTRESSKLTQKCAATVKFQLFEHRLLFVSSI